MGKIVRIVREHFYVLGGGPLGSEVEMGLCSSSRDGTSEHGPFIGIKWVGHVRELHVILEIQMGPGRDCLGRSIGSWFM